MIAAAPPRLIFIGGSGRCGTSVTKNLLARHPDVATLAFEYRFTLDPDGLVDFLNSFAATWSPFLADRRLQRLERFLRALGRRSAPHGAIATALTRLGVGSRRLTRQQYFGWELARHLPNYGAHIDRLMARLAEFRYAASWVGSESYRWHPVMYYGAPLDKASLIEPLSAFLCDVVADILRTREKSVYVEDNTHNILFAEDLLRLAPGAKLIHVYRDPRDVVASLMRQRWAPDRADQAAIWYRDLMRRWLEIRPRLAGDRVLEIRLEDLIARTGEITRRVCEFADLPYDPHLVDTDLSRGNVGRWQRDLSDADARTVDQILQPLIAVFGPRQT